MMSRPFSLLHISQYAPVVYGKRVVVSVSMVNSGPSIDTALLYRCVSAQLLLSLIDLWISGLMVVHTPGCLEHLLLFAVHVTL